MERLNREIQFRIREAAPFRTKARCSPLTTAVLRETDDERQSKKTLLTQDYGVTSTAKTIYETTVALPATNNKIRDCRLFLRLKKSGNHTMGKQALRKLPESYTANSEKYLHKPNPVATRDALDSTKAKVEHIGWGGGTMPGEGLEPISGGTNETTAIIYSMSDVEINMINAIPDNVEFQIGIASNLNFMHVINCSKSVGDPDYYIIPPKPAGEIKSWTRRRPEDESSMTMLRFGKHPPKKDYRTLRLKEYFTSALAPPPPSYDVLPRVYQNLGTSQPAELFPLDGNDSFGDCTIAAVAHAVTTYRGLLGTRKIMNKNAVVKLYLHLTGGVDSGLVELDVLNYWRKNAVSGDKILAYASIDVKNHRHVQQAIQLFGGVYLGFQVQENCVEQFDAGQPWTPAPLTNDGHAVFAIAYDSSGVTVLTWGNTQKATWAWWDECVDEAYAILPPEAKATDFAPGFNFAQLQADLALVAN